MHSVMTDTWVIPLPTTTTDYQYTKFRQCSSNRTLDSCLFISQSEHICEWGIKFAHSVTSDLVGNTCAHHNPHTKFHPCGPYKALDIISQSEQICKWHIKYAHSVTTDYMGSTCVHHYPHTKFHHCSSYRTLDTWLILLLANLNRHANEVLNMRIQSQQTTWVVLGLITTHIPSFITVAYTRLRIFAIFVFGHSEQICKWKICAFVDDSPHG